MNPTDVALQPRFRLYLLGGTSVIGPEGPVGAVAADERLIALLSLLATAPGPSATVEAIAVTLRPDVTPVEAIAALRSDVERLAEALGEDVVRPTASGLTLDPDLIWCDVGAYRDHLGRGDRLAAAADYQGPFLDRFHLPGAAAFNQWMHAERAEFASAFRDIAAGLADEAMAGRDGQAAARWWTRLVDADPWNPRAARQAMSGFEAMGESAAAIAVAEEFLGRTAERLGREPDPDIAANLERLRAAPPARPRRTGMVAAALLVAVAILLAWLFW